MHITKTTGILVERIQIDSKNLQRKVLADCYLPKNVADPSLLSLLLINDGQNMEEMGFSEILDDLYSGQKISPLFCVAVHAGKERKMEYGVAAMADYLGRGAMAGEYTSFILDELIPYLQETYHVPYFHDAGFAGFSLGGLSAMDIAWNYPHLFSRVGVFSGSFWWRSIDQSDNAYDDDKHRIMQQQIREGEYKPGIKFFLQCGNKDETMDRNNNGIIDSIDDTMDIIKELVAKGYDEKNDIEYLEMPDGKHDVPTWGEAMPVFLKWGWGR